MPRWALTASAVSELAIADLKDGKLLGHTVSLTSEDALCTPAGGATAATKLAADPSIVALVGSTLLGRDRRRHRDPDGRGHDHYLAVKHAPGPDRPDA
jgi:hypothetical protein